MSEVYNIPIKYKEGVYGINDIIDIDDAIELNYEEYGEIVTYALPNFEYGQEITLYSIPKNTLETTLQATYDNNGHLKKVTINNGNKEVLLYIHYKNMEETKEKIKNFAIENANDIIKKIYMCKEKVSRLFVEYFNDVEYMDFHAKIGTKAQKIALEKEYPDYNDIVNSCGDYDSEYINGDNDKLKIMVSCADNDEFDYFQFAVDIMTELIKEKALVKLDKADDFEFLCMEYD